VTASGTFATGYFLSPQIPAFPTLHSLRRATTTSFGSICLGSLLVSITQILRSLASDRNYLLQCILSLLENILKYFNRYAFTQVAIYGKSYIDAATSTWKLILERGLDAVINDNLSNGVLNLGCFFWRHSECFDRSRTWFCFLS